MASSQPGQTSRRIFDFAHRVVGLEIAIFWIVANFVERDVVAIEDPPLAVLDCFAPNVRFSTLLFSQTNLARLVVEHISAAPAYSDQAQGNLRMASPEPCILSARSSLLFGQPAYRGARTLMQAAVKSKAVR